MKLTIATAQFPISGDIIANRRYIVRQMRAAARRGADVVHFPETALSGYAGIDFTSFEGFDWDVLTEATELIMSLARDLRVWVVLGSTHRLSRHHLPHNCLYVIDNRGCLTERYDKCFCTGDRKGLSGDLAHYSPGDHLSVWTIRGAGGSGVRCGALICHDFRYPELYRQYYAQGVRVMFHSYHNAHNPKRLAPGDNIHGMIVPPTMQAYASTNNMFISATNSSAFFSRWPGFFVHPDGRIVNRMTSNRSAVMINVADTSAHFYDASKHWRDRCLRGILHSGNTVRDARSADRTRL